MILPLGSAARDLTQVCRSARANSVASPLAQSPSTALCTQPSACSPKTDRVAGDQRRGWEGEEEAGSKFTAAPLWDGWQRRLH